MKKESILNYFPKKENLTEISILSIYEVVIYVAIFAICLWLYFSWTDVPQKNIDICAERIDTLINYLPDDYSSNTESGKPSLRTAGVIHITIPLSDINLEDYPLFYSHFWMDEDAYYYDSRDVYNKNRSKRLTDDFNTRRDSLLALYEFAYRNDITAGKSPVFYRKYETDAYNSARMNPIEGIDFQDDKSFVIISRDGHGILRTYIDNSFTTSSKLIYESIGEQGFTDQMTQKNTSIDKPSILNLFDISQCYYNIRIHSETIDSIYLVVNFTGANEFTFVESKPDEVDCQQLIWNLKRVQSYRPHSWYRGKNHIIFHVKSKELENKQNARVFFVSTVLSGLIILFLAFIIILFYRFFTFYKRKSTNEVGELVKKEALSERESNINEEESTSSTNELVENDNNDKKGLKEKSSEKKQN